MASQQPNVLLIICDDLNNAITGMGRTPHAPCPNLQSLMRDGVRFVNAYSNCPICMPARNMFLSGLYAHTTGQYTLWDAWRSCTQIPWTQMENSRYHGIPLLGGAVTLPRHFRNNGYAVFGAGKVHHEGAGNNDWWDEYAYGPNYGPTLHRGTDIHPCEHPKRRELYDCDALRAYVKRFAGLDRMFVRNGLFGPNIEMTFGSLPEIFADHQHLGLEAQSGGQPWRYVNDEDRDPLPDERVADWAVEVLQREHNRPFFLATGFMKPHSPLNVPQKYFDQFPLASLELPPIRTNDIDDCARALVEHWPYGFLKYAMVIHCGETMLRRWLQAYLACVAFVDDQVGKLLRALRSGPYADNTLVVFTSDNGFHMGEKEYQCKQSLWEEGSQIPLIVSGAGIAARGGICRRPVSLIDLYPTLCDLCVLPGNPHQATHGHPLQGHSLRPFLADPTHGIWEGPDVALMSVRGNTGIHHSVRSERYRYTLCGNGEEELYDHQADPHEWHNRQSDPSLIQVKADLRGKMLKILNSEPA